jgi:hypothetical protein
MANLKRTLGDISLAQTSDLKKQKTNTEFSQILQRLFDLKFISDTDAKNLQQVNTTSRNDIKMNIKEGSEIYIDKRFSFASLINYLKGFKNNYDPQKKCNNMKIKVKSVILFHEPETGENLAEIINQYSNITIEELCYSDFGNNINSKELILLEMCKSENIVIKKLTMRMNDFNNVLSIPLADVLITKVSAFTNRVLSFEIYIDKQFQYDDFINYLQSFKTQYDPTDKSKKMKIKVKSVILLYDLKLEMEQNLAEIINKYSNITIEELRYSDEGDDINSKELILLKMCKSENIVIEKLTMMMNDFNNVLSIPLADALKVSAFTNRVLSFLRCFANTTTQSLW